MKQALVIFNGIGFSHQLIEKAFAWAKQAAGSVHVLFLASRETEDQYAFPSDLDEAQEITDKSDAEQSDMKVLDSRIQLLENMAADANVTCKTEILVGPSLSDVLSKAADASIIFVDAREDDEAGLMAVTTFEMDELLEQLPAEVEKVFEG